MTNFRRIKCIPVARGGAPGLSPTARGHDAGLRLNQVGRVHAKEAEGHVSRQSSRPASKTSSAGKGSGQSPRDGSTGFRETAKTEGLWDRVENEKMQPIGDCLLYTSDAADE